MSESTAHESNEAREQLDALAAELEVLRHDHAKLAHERERYRKLYLELLERYQKLERGLLSQQRRERFVPDETQLTLSLLAELLGQAPAPSPPPEAPREVRAHVRKPPTGRRPVPETLPRIEIEVIPEEVKREGLDAFTRIGEETSVVVERRAACFVALEIVRPKFVRKGAAERMTTPAPRIVIAEPPELPIPRGLAGPALLADTIVRRWQDHLPLNRLEKIYAREGFELSRATLCGWHEELSLLARPLVEAMWVDALQEPVLHTDATGVLVQAKERCRRCHFFVVVAPDRHVLFRFTAKHDAQAVDRILAGYRGFLVADAHSVFDHLYGEGGATEVACWAHCRRYFFKSLASEPELAREALTWIGKLFEIEREVAERSASERLGRRQRESRRLADGFFKWCELHSLSVLEGTPIAKAIQYARNHQVAFLRFLDDPRLPMHNNASERALRRQAIGRRNWLFLGSDHGAEANTTFVTLLASCQLHAIEPQGYLRDLLCLLPSWKQSRVLELAPVHWKSTLARDDVRVRLEANPFRRVVLTPTA